MIPVNAELNWLGVIRFPWSGVVGRERGTARRQVTMTR